MVLIATDLLLIPLAVWLSFALRLAHPWPDQLQGCLWLFIAAWLVAPLIYVFTGQYKGITRYAGSQALYALALRNLAVVVILHLVGLALQLPAPPRSTAANALIKLAPPIMGSRLVSSANRMPPAAANTEASVQTTALTFGMLTPMMAANSKLSAVARRDFPIRLFVKSR